LRSCDRPALGERCPRKRRGCCARDEQGDARPPCCECHSRYLRFDVPQPTGVGLTPPLTLWRRGRAGHRVFAVSADYAAPVELRLATAGESHGPALVAIVSGLPAGLVLGHDAID